MDLITIETYAKLWFAVSTAIVFIKYFLNQNNQFTQTVLTELKQIKLNTWKSILSKEQTIRTFRAVLNEHIRQKILYVKWELIANDIKNRSKQIKLWINQEFSRITQQEASFLSTFNTPAGDIGEVLLTVLNDQEQWQAFIQSVYSVVFWEWDITTKLKDISNIMNEIVNNLVAIIEKKL